MGKDHSLANILGVGKSLKRRQFLNGILKKSGFVFIYNLLPKHFSQRICQNEKSSHMQRD